MKKSKLENLSKKILNLEQECQKGENVSENLEEMEKIANKLSLVDLFRLAEILENNLKF